MDLEFVITIVATFIISLVIFLLGININKPKLVVNGGGGGNGSGNPDIHYQSIRIWNDPSLLGIKIDRLPAKIKNVYLIDRASKEIFTLKSNWQNNNSPETSRQVTIEVGDYLNLNLFAKAKGAEKYYICNGSVNTKPNDPEYFDDEEKEFRLKIVDGTTRTYPIDIKVNNKGDGVTIQYSLTMAHRFILVKEAFGLLLYALRLKKY